MDKTNRYRKPVKQNAYETALRCAAEHELIESTYEWLVSYLGRLYPSLAPPDARDVAAKAIRVERGRQHKPGD